MAETEVHKRKRSKNLVLLAIILGWCLLIWLVTMVRMAQAQQGYGSPAFGAAVAVGMENEPSDELRVTAGAETPAAKPFDLEYFFSKGRSRHQAKMDDSLEGFLERGRQHQSKIAPNPEKWWPGWQDRLLPKDYGPPAE